MFTSSLKLDFFFWLAASNRQLRVVQMMKPKSGQSPGVINN